MRRMIVVLLLLSASNAWGLNVTMTTKVIGGYKPYVEGTTNLPDNTNLVISIKRNESSYAEQANAVVSAGKFHAGPFTQKGAPLIAGIYALTIKVPFAPIQPSSVQAYIGVRGQNLSGPLVKKGGLGKWVEYRTSVKVPSIVYIEKDTQAR